MGGYVVDTSAWIEFFRGSVEGSLVAKHIFPEPSEMATILTPTIVISELRSTYIRDGKDSQFYEDLEKIRSIGIIFQELDESTSIDAGTKHRKSHTPQNQISQIDCILWAIAEKMDMKVLSTDKHFKDCPSAVFIPMGGE
ncbi:MAG: PIN domain-containing protein [Thermoplasmata archaeon]|nr:PIN domain-containing protein [Thermoplasmata archaeon]